MLMKKYNSGPCQHQVKSLLDMLYHSSLLSKKEITFTIEDRKKQFNFINHLTLNDLRRLVPKTSNSKTYTQTFLTRKGSETLLRRKTSSHSSINCLVTVLHEGL